MRRRWIWAGLLLVPLAVASYRTRGAGTGTRDAPALTVMTAASMTQPMRALLDSFAHRSGVRYDLESGASLEIARRITDLHRTPDLVILADPEVFPQLLVPDHARWYATFARNRIVLAYTPASRGADSITAANWRRVILQPGVEVGRADPNTDPSGYRTLLTMQLAERYYREPGLFRRLLDGAPPRNVRPREADQVALLQTHELDYIWTYENLARNDGLRFVNLPDEIDLGTPADSALYARVSTRVLGKRPGDTLTMRGAPILFAFSIPSDAAHPAAAERFAAYMLSNDGKRVLRAQHVDVLEAPATHGSGVPASLGLTPR